MDISESCSQTKDISDPPCSDPVLIKRDTDVNSLDSNSTCNSLKHSVDNSKRFIKESKIHLLSDSEDSFEVFLPKKKTASKATGKPSNAGKLKSKKAASRSRTCPYFSSKSVKSYFKPPQKTQEEKDLELALARSLLDVSGSSTALEPEKPKALPQEPKLKLKKWKGKDPKKTVKYLLPRRTPEERESIITQKLGIILLEGNESTEDTFHKFDVELTSSVLEEFYNQNAKLWELSKLNVDCYISDFYIDAFKNIIDTPSSVEFYDMKSSSQASQPSSDESPQEWAGPVEEMCKESVCEQSESCIDAPGTSGLNMKADRDEAMQDNVEIIEESLRSDENEDMFDDTIPSCQILDKSDRSPFLRPGKQNHETLPSSLNTDAEGKEEMEGDPVKIKEESMMCYKEEDMFDDSRPTSHNKLQVKEDELNQLSQRHVKVSDISHEIPSSSLNGVPGVEIHPSRGSDDEDMFEQDIRPSTSKIPDELLLQNVKQEVSLSQKTEPASLPGDFEVGDDDPGLVTEKPTSEVVGKEDSDETIKYHTSPEKNNRFLTSLESLKILSNDWQSLYEKYDFSDMDFHVKDRFFPGHKIILHVRCPDLLRDVYDSLDRGILDLSMYEKKASLALIRYLYSGKTDKMASLSDSEKMDLRLLATKYNIAYLVKLLPIDSERDLIYEESTCSIPQDSISSNSCPPKENPIKDKPSTPLIDIESTVDLDSTNSLPTNNEKSTEKNSRFFMRSPARNDSISAKRKLETEFNETIEINDDGSYDTIKRKSDLFSNEIHRRVTRSSTKANIIIIDSDSNDESSLGRERPPGDKPGDAKSVKEATNSSTGFVSLDQSGSDEMKYNFPSTSTFGVYKDSGKMDSSPNNSQSHSSFSLSKPSSISNSLSNLPSTSKFDIVEYCSKLDTSPFKLSPNPKLNISEHCSLLEKYMPDLPSTSTFGLTDGPDIFDEDTIPFSPKLSPLKDKSPSLGSSPLKYFNSMESPSPFRDSDLHVKNHDAIEKDSLDNSCELITTPPAKGLNEVLAQHGRFDKSPLDEEEEDPGPSRKKNRSLEDYLQSSFPSTSFLERAESQALPASSTPVPSTSGVAPINKTLSRLKALSTPPDCRLQAPIDLSTPQGEVSLIVKDATPRPDYSLMESPELKEELKKYGLKTNLGQKKAKDLLSYIYDQLHPSKSDDQNDEYVENDRSNGRSSDNEDPNEFLLEESLFNESKAGDVSESVGTVDPSSLREIIINFLKNDKNLYLSVITFEPLLLKVFYKTLKDHGVRCKISELMDTLDSLSINYRVERPERKTTKRKRKFTKGAKS